MSLLICSIVILFGVTLSYFVREVSGNGKNITIKTARLGIVYTDGPELGVDNAIPGSSFTKTFTVENTSDEEGTYEIYIKDLINTFINNELVFSLKEETKGEVLGNSPIDRELLLSNIKIVPGETHNYTLTIKFLETGTSQNSNMGAEFTGKVQIRESHFVDIELVEKDYSKITVKAVAKNFANIDGVKYSKDSGVTWTGIEGLSYQFTGLTMDTDYDIKLSVIESADFKMESGILRVRTSLVNPPSITLTASTKTTNSVSLTATASDASVGIKPNTYEFSKDNGSTWTTAQASNTYTFTGLTSNTAYNFKARVQNNLNMTGTSATLGVTTATIGSTITTQTGSCAKSPASDTTYEYIYFCSSGTLQFNQATTFDAFLVGGGGGGSSSYSTGYGAGGAGGYTKTNSGLSIAANTSILVTVGTGGAAGPQPGLNKGYSGGYSEIINSSYRANGGEGGFNDSSIGSGGGTGGSGGGGPGSSTPLVGGIGGSNGGNGTRNSVSHGLGQVTTTRAFGEASGALYAGGGGGGGINEGQRGAGGSGGGGNGGYLTVSGVNGTVNTGGGGGGSGATYPSYPGSGGSGIVIVRIRK